MAAYSFTTLTAIPGVLEYGGAEIQVLDLPSIIEGAAEGKGRARHSPLEKTKMVLCSPLAAELSSLDEQRTSCLVLFR